VLSDSADFLYKTTDYYVPDFERSLAWNDPQIAVSWPIDNGMQPIVSAKDTTAKKLAEAEVFA
jgi:dTDP-4-dehydrorhamnose 3,5-epimerase